MSIPTTQKAVVIEGKKAVVKSNIPVPELTEGTVLIKTKAVAGNPTDWKHIEYGIGPQGSILGCDVAGTIIKFGPNTKSDKFHIGDTVYSFAHGASVKFPENGAFAEYVRVNLDTTYKGNLTHAEGDEIPEGKVEHFESAASLPVSLTTAGVSLTHHLGSKMEWKPSAPQHDFPLFIWGGATAVGQKIIQLAKSLNSYTKIVAVASKKHEQLLKGYGLDDLFDYHDADVIQQIKSKYPNLTHVIDAVSSEESFVEAYKVASDDSPATVFQLTTLSIANIPEKDRKTNVKIDGTMLYMAGGHDVVFGSMTLPANPAYRKATAEFIEFINPHVENGDIHHMRVKIFKNGIEDVPALTEGIKNGDNKNVKFVASFL